MIIALTAASVLALCDPTLKSCTKFEPTDSLEVHRTELCAMLRDAWSESETSFWNKVWTKTQDADERIYVVSLLNGTINDQNERSARCYAWARGERTEP